MISSIAVEELRPEVAAQRRRCTCVLHALVAPRRVAARRSSRMNWLPTLLVMMMTVFLKSTVRPWPSVRRPSSSTWSRTLNTSGCAFSISSNRTTLVRPAADRLGQLAALLVADVARRRADQPRRRCASPCTRSCRCAPSRCSSSNRNSASARASSVLPTPVGPRKMNEPIGRFGSLRPARARRTASATACDGLVLADDALVQLAPPCAAASACSPSSSRVTGMPVQRLTTCGDVVRVDLFLQQRGWCRRCWASAASCSCSCFCSSGQLAVLAARRPCP